MGKLGISFHRFLLRRMGFESFTSCILMRVRCRPIIEMSTHSETLKLNEILVLEKNKGSYAKIRALNDTGFLCHQVLQIKKKKN